MKIKYLMLATSISMSLLAVAAKKASGPKYYKEIQTMGEYEAACNYGEPVVIKYGAPWCAACTQMEPVYNNCAQKYRQARFYTVDVAKKQFKPLVKKHKIEGLPTVIFSKRGKEVKRERGSITNQDELNQSVDTFINGPKSLMVTRKADSSSEKKSNQK